MNRAVICGLNNEGTIDSHFREVATLEDTEGAMSEGGQKIVQNITETKEFDTVMYIIQQCGNEATKRWKFANTVKQGRCQDSDLHMTK